MTNLERLRIHQEIDKLENTLRNRFKSQTPADQGMRSYILEQIDRLRILNN